MAKLNTYATVLALALALGRPALADRTFTAVLEGSQEVLPVASPGTGVASVTLNTAETQITVDMSFSGLNGTTTASHIHGPATRGVNAGVVFPLTIPVGVTSGAVSNQVIAVTPADVQNLRAGLWYVNVHTAAFPGGEIRGQLDAERAVPAATTWGLLVLGSLLAAAGALTLLRS